MPGYCAPWPGNSHATFISLRRLLSVGRLLGWLLRFLSPTRYGCASTTCQSASRDSASSRLSPVAGALAASTAKASLLCPAEECFVLVDPLDGVDKPTL